ncbi:unnamed protein product [Echinostoma caproni]|uniref:WD_REPEATS_REGION domain-containing protein n=1 Tax=Echinostoma caproni TaxID=27848 RepID=A0A183B1K4_9TREM|nr:unnamed protein product [Echinostoma caproni]
MGSDAFSINLSVPRFLINGYQLSQSPIMEYEQSLRNKLRSGSIPLNPSSDPTLSERRMFGRGLSWRTILTNTALSSVDSIETGTSAGGTLRRTAIATAYDPVDGLTYFGERYSSGSEAKSHVHGIADLGALDATPQGTLVAHLHEHQAGMISLAVHGSGRLMVSCSAGDGTVKLWNCGLWPVDADGYLNQNTPTSSLIGESGSRNGSKPAGFTQIYSLPTRSSWTYCTQTSDSEISSKVCRVATITRGDWIHCVDVATGRQCSLNSLAHKTHGRALCLTASATTQFPAQLTLLRPGLSNGGGGDANLIAYATAGNYIVARDLRAPFSEPPAWGLKQVREYGNCSDR